MSVDSHHSRTAKDIIDDAIHENKQAALLLYYFAIAFSIFGMGLVIYGIYSGSSLSSVIGVISSTFLWPAENSARRTRKENISIRLLEAPLSQSSTADEAAKMLHKLFNEIFKDTVKNNDV